MIEKKRIIAATELLLIFPAVLFLIAVVARRLEPLQYLAQQIVTWYSVRLWTLWVLLISLPIIALLAGGSTLLWNSIDGAKELQTASHSSWATRIIFAVTLAAGLMLIIVILHMLAN